MIIRRAQFFVNYYERGRVKYAQGRDYPVTDQTRSQLMAGNAALVSHDVGPIGWALHRLQERIAERRIRRAQRATIEAEQRTR